MEKFLSISTFLAIVICVMLTGKTEAQASGTAGIHQVIETSLPVYLDSSEESSVVGYLTQGDFVTAESSQSDWTYIHANRYTGYVLNSGITIAKPTSYIVNKKEGTNLYTYPSPNAQKNGTLFDKSIVNVYGTAPGGWSFVQYGHQIGFVASNSLKLPTTTKKRVNAVKGAQVHLTASPSSEVLGTITHETVVEQYTIIAGWAYVEAGEQKGYVKALELTNLVSLGNKAYNNGVAAAKGQTKRVALTFDDGPDAKVTPQILAVLKKYEAKATFFMVGRNVLKNQSIVQQMYEDGHEIGNHTWNHPKLTKLSNDSVKQEVDYTSNAIYKAIGQNPTVFRPPYGATSNQVRSVISMPTILWSVDTLDWKHRNADKLLSYVKASAKDGSIILMHDIHQSTANGLENVILYLQKQGYELVTVSEILQ
ncbi:polysaccharide deacetylase family protein [Lysinibacillus sp. NPDC097287]|uniref:polysaccharide deacetylase family protein n=1 Tax=Lysinibacillus sp. NPDC097287 TaxID=3364144 RepID=UPI00382C43A5